MNKILSLILIGTLVTFIFDFLIILTAKINYLDFYGIHTYYNQLFFDTQNGFIFFIGILIYGGVFVLFDNIKISMSIFFISFLVVLTFFIPTNGYNIGAYIFKSENHIYKRFGIMKKGDILYENFEKYYIYDKDTENIIVINKFD